jgi:hypothetical protein
MKIYPDAPPHPRVGGRDAAECSEFLNLVQKQLTDDLDHNCKPLGLQNRPPVAWTSALFFICIITLIPARN